MHQLRPQRIKLIDVIPFSAPVHDRDIVCGRRHSLCGRWRDRLPMHDTMRQAHIVAPRQARRWQMVKPSVPAI
jgi:hypothetical protein